MVTCPLCGNLIDTTGSMFDGDTLVHISCYKQESKRSQREDSNGDGTRSRPPKYMLDPSEYSKYGY